MYNLWLKNTQKTKLKLLNTLKDWVYIGKFGKVHGIKGNIRIYSFTEPMENFVAYKPKYICSAGKWQEIEFESLIVKDKFILAKVKGCDIREDAEKLTNAEIAIKKEQLPKLEDEYYWHELVGMQVKTTQNELLGKVIEILPTGSNDVLVIEGNKRHLIPYRPEFIVNIKDGNITVDWEY